jgi:hypothetical protein
MAARSLVPAERIARMVLRMRGHTVLLDEDIAALYAVETKAWHLKRVGRASLPPSARTKAAPDRVPSSLKTVNKRPRSRQAYPLASWRLMTCPIYGDHYQPRALVRLVEEPLH